MVLNSARNACSSWTASKTNSRKNVRRSKTYEKRRPSFFAATVVAVICSGGLASEFSVVAAEDSAEQPSLSFDRPDSSVALLVALQDGPAGEDDLREWSSYVDGVFETGVPGEKIPSVWIMTYDRTAVALADELPHVWPLTVSPDQSWAETLGDFVYQNEAATTFGLLGEGALPRPGLFEAAMSIETALARSDDPTLVLARSRSANGGDGGGGGGGGGGVTADSFDGWGSVSRGGGAWLSDAFASQIWVNADILVLDRLEAAGLDVRAVQDLSLLRVLPYLIEGSMRDGASVVDGTSVMWSLFSVGENGQQDPPAAEQDGSTLRIGTSELALVRGRDGDGDVEVGKAPWPPSYVLETVANEDGLVMVNSVNCGYLDFAANFLQSVRRFSDAKVGIILTRGICW